MVQTEACQAVISTGVGAAAAHNDLGDRSLFDPAVATRIASMWVLTLALSVAASHPVFAVLL